MSPFVDELCPEGDGVETMHDVLHYDGGETVKIAHDAPLFIPQNMCRHLISEFKDSLRGSQSGNSTSSVSTISFSSGSNT
jgi:hypothetical protein